MPKLKRKLLSSTTTKPAAAPVIPAVAEKPVSKRAAKRADKPVLPDASTVPPVAADAPKPAARPTHATAVTAGNGLGSYTEHGGASQSFRGHGRKLTAVILDSNPGSVTERDADFVRDLRAAYGDKPFSRLDIDAGNMRRAIANGHAVYIDGGQRAGNTVSGRDARFQLTPAGFAYGKPSA